MKYNVSSAVLVLFVIILNGTRASAQSNNEDFPVAGKPCPNFVLKDVYNRKKDSICLNDFKGKWLLLDFWNRGCYTCVKKMPFMDSIQKEFDHVKILYVGYTGSQYRSTPDERGIKELFQKVSQKKQFGFEMTFDSVLFHRFFIGPCPTIVIVDPAGIVKGIVTGFTRYQLKRVIGGEAVLDWDRGYRWKEGKLEQVPL